MGWMFGPKDTPKSIAAEFTAGWEGMTCDAACLTKEGGYLVLWAVMRYTADSERYKKGFRWIACVLIQAGHGGWGSKSMSEDMGPCYYSCPTEFLTMAPNPGSPYSSDWRAKVYMENTDR